MVVSLVVTGVVMVVLRVVVMVIVVVVDVAVIVVVVVVSDGTEKPKNLASYSYVCHVDRMHSGHCTKGIKDVLFTPTRLPLALLTCMVVKSVSLYH